MELDRSQDPEGSGERGPDGGVFRRFIAELARGRLELVVTVMGVPPSAVLALCPKTAPTPCSSSSIPADVCDYRLCRRRWIAALAGPPPLEKLPDDSSSHTD